MMQPKEIAMLSDAGWKAVEVNIMSGVGATLQA